MEQKIKEFLNELKEFWYFLIGKKSDSIKNEINELKNRSMNQIKRVSDAHNGAAVLYAILGESEIIDKKSRTIKVNFITVVFAPAAEGKDKRFKEALIYQLKKDIKKLKR